MALRCPTRPPSKARPCSTPPTSCVTHSSQMMMTTMGLNVHRCLSPDPVDPSDSSGDEDTGR
eukprot:5853936-Prymnesium_polylepis.1